MEDAARSLLDLWERTDDAVGRLGTDGWSRPTPCAGTDVTDLVVHLAGVHYAGPDRLHAALGVARERAARRLADRTPSPRVLRAECLDMCLHAHDLAAAVGEPLDLADHAPATRAACELLVHVAPRLLVAAAGGRDVAVRLVVRTGGDRTVHVAGGRLSAAQPVPADTVEVDPWALVLLLAGRRDADTLAATGSLAWSGVAADAFVHHARLSR